MLQVGDRPTRVHDSGLYNFLCCQLLGSLPHACNEAISSIPDNLRPIHQFGQGGEGDWRLNFFSNLQMRLITWRQGVTSCADVWMQKRMCDFCLGWCKVSLKKFNVIICLKLISAQKEAELQELWHLAWRSILPILIPAACLLLYLQKKGETILLGNRR